VGAWILALQALYSNRCYCPRSCSRNGYCKSAVVLGESFSWHQSRRAADAVSRLAFRTMVILTAQFVSSNETPGTREPSRIRRARQRGNVRAAATIALHPGRFFVRNAGYLADREDLEQAVPWEIFRTHLLDAPTPGIRLILRPGTYLSIANSLLRAPLISIKWQSASRRIFITRQILTHAFEAYEDAPGVILSRPVHNGLSELVGSLGVETWRRKNLSAEVSRTFSWR